MTNREQIVEQALTLTPEDHAYVAEALEMSLSNEGFASHEIADAWAEELERRVSAYDRGEVQAIGAAVAVDRMRRHLAQHRMRQVTS